MFKFLFKKNSKIRKLKTGEKYKYIVSDIKYSEVQIDEKNFVNDKNFLHNDVGPATKFGNGPGGFWHWNGRWIK